MSVREAIDSSKMSMFQIWVVAICLIINIIDGFDVLVMSFAASGVADEWGLSDSEVGVLLSSGLIGMALGSAVIAPLADRIGRRLLTISCLAICAIGMALAAISTSSTELGLCRLLTGLGIGGMVASLPVLIAEYSPARRRGTAIAMYAAGLPVGGILGGIVAQALISGHGWRAPFWVGAALTAAMLVMVVVALPESLDFLEHRRSRGALKKVNVQLARMHIAPLTTLSVSTTRSHVRARGGSIFAGGNGARTILLWISYFIMMSGFYFAASWTPRLLGQSGFSASQGMNGGLFLNIGGVIGTVGLGFVAWKVSGKILTPVAFVCAGASFLLMSVGLGSIAVTLCAAVALGMFLNASGAGLNTLAPSMYQAHVRATGVGWAVGFGRIGALTAPIVAGVLLDRSWSGQSLFALLALPMIIGAIAVLVISRNVDHTNDRRREFAAPELAS